MIPLADADPDLPDISGRNDLIVVVDDFYGRIRADARLGPIFTDVAAVDWTTHIPKIVDFWEKALFRTGNYRGNPLRAHIDLNDKVQLGRPLFDRWLELFEATVDDHFAGDRAGHLKRIAADIAGVMHSRIAGVPQGFTSPALKAQAAPHGETDNSSPPPR